MSGACVPSVAKAAMARAVVVRVAQKVLRFMTEFPFRVVWVRPAGPRRGMARLGVREEEGVRDGAVAAAPGPPVARGRCGGQMKVMSQWMPPLRGIS
ncbi:hypothetical protein GCM10015535_69380 [Streptomyces gelaticus]|uniref:Uncharacterized protein n=1 Tax=Streptomyces gelaticus TaxID=285446 RepID=A0ABQ2WC37_9ACTN|nr:hypothetical protein GCM10015535_69380 [Streptomyces gelaticus]